MSSSSSALGPAAGPHSPKSAQPRTVTFATPAQPTDPEELATMGETGRSLLQLMLGSGMVLKSAGAEGEGGSSSLPPSGLGRRRRRRGAPWSRARGRAARAP